MAVHYQQFSPVHITSPYLSLRRRTACAEFAFRLLHSSPEKPLIPSHLALAYLSWKALTPAPSRAPVLRSSSSGTQRLSRPRTEILCRSTVYHCVQLLNNIPAAQPLYPRFVPFFFHPFSFSLPLAVVLFFFCLALTLDTSLWLLWCSTE